MLAWSANAEQNPNDGPLLTLDQAVQTAVANNRVLKIYSLDVDKSKWQVASTKTHRLPSLNTYVFGSGLLTPVNFTFPAGLFGKVDGKAIPEKTTQITNQGFTAYAVGQVAQPLSQLYKLNLGVREQELSSDLASQKYREQRQTVVKDTKQGYYAVLQSQSSIEATQASIKQYEELDRVTQEKISQEAVLKSDTLEVKAKLAQEKYKLLQLQDELQTRKENLNDLMARDLETPFRVEEVPPVSPEEGDLRTAQQKALSSRPEIKQAEIQVQQADYERRIAKAAYIPDIGLAVHYLSPFGVDFVPKNVVSAGFEFTYEPFQWGRRKDDVNQKKIMLDQSQYQLKEAQSKVLLDVDNRFRKLHESRVLLDVTQAAQLAATEKLREVTQKYQQQSVLLRDLFQQQAAVVSADSDYEQALLSFWNAKADFEKAIGED